MDKKAISENLSSLMTGIIFVGIGFAAGYAVSDFFMEDAMPPAAAVSAVETAPPVLYTPAPVFEEEPQYYGTYYLVKAEGEELLLYEADGNNRKLLRKSKINMNSFPAADAEELKNGINTGTLEGALEIWESFIE